jgi:molybdate transport system permease protein
MAMTGAPRARTTAVRFTDGASTRGGFLLLGLALVYVLLVVGPLLGLLIYAPLRGMPGGHALAAFRDTLWLTLSTSAASTLLAVVLGLPTAMCLARLEFPGKRLVNALVELPIALPPLVMGVALILVWGRKGLIGEALGQAGLPPITFTTSAVVIAQFVVSSPFLVRIARIAIERVPLSLEEASLTLGRGRLGTYLHVTLPIARNGLLSGVVTAWARAMGEFGATFLFAGNFPGRTQTIPLAIFTSMQSDVNAAIGLGLIMSFFSLGSFLLAWRVLERAD